MSAVNGRLAGLQSGLRRRGRLWAFLLLSLPVLLSLTACGLRSEGGGLPCFNEPLSLLRAEGSNINNEEVPTGEFRIEVLVDLQSNAPEVASAVSAELMTEARERLVAGQRVYIRLRIFEGVVDGQEYWRTSTCLDGAGFFARHQNMTRQDNRVEAIEFIPDQVRRDMTSSTPKPAGGPLFLLDRAEAPNANAPLSAEEGVTIIWSNFLANDLSCLDGSHPRLILDSGETPPADEYLAEYLVGSCGDDFGSAVYTGSLRLIGWDSPGPFKKFGETIADQICRAMTAAVCEMRGVE